MFVIVDSSTVVLAIVDDIKVARFIQSCFLDSIIEEIFETDIQPGVYRLLDHKLSLVDGVYPEIANKINVATILFDGFMFSEILLRKVEINNQLFSESQVLIYKLSPVDFIQAFATAHNVSCASAKKHIEFCMSNHLTVACKIQALRWTIEEKLRKVKTKDCLDIFKFDVLFLLDGKGQM